MKTFLYEIINFLLNIKILYVLFAIIGIILILKYRKFLMNLFGKLKSHIHTIWFLAVFVSTLVYCLQNWSKVIVLEPLTGNFIMFCFLLVLAVLPFISKFKIFDFEGVINNPLLQAKEYAENNLNSIANKTENMPNIDINVNVQNELREEVKKIKAEKGVSNVK